LVEPNEAARARQEVLPRERQHERAAASPATGYVVCGGSLS